MRLLANLAALFFMLTIIAVLAVSYVIYEYGKDLPDTQQLANYDPPMVTRLYAADGRLMAEYATEKRSFVPVKAIPKHVLEAFISAEDKNFYLHSGVDFMGTGRALLQNVETISQGGNQNLVGGSTITQQVVKNFLLTNEKSVERKIKEAILSFRISKVYSKDRILELYMNQIYLGFNSYGVAAAALNYFNKSLDELTLEEAAFLAVLPKAPNNYNPRLYYDRAKERRDWVIGRMLEDGYITLDEAKIAIATPIVTRTRDETETTTAEFFAEEVRRQLIEQYGGDTLYKGGLAVRTTLDPNLQGIAQRAMREALESYDQRHGYRGPVAQVASLKYWQDGLAGIAKPPVTENWKLAVVLALKANAVELGLPGGNTGVMPFENMKWARKWLPEQRYGAEIAKPSDALKPGDVILVEAKESEGKVDYFLRQVPQVNGAMVVMDPFTGRVLAMVGGYGYGVTEFNRATQARRQPGSAFKPFVYVTALEKGFTPSSIILDAPVELSQGPGQPMWRPENYTGKFYGPSTLRKGVEHSRNAMTVRLALRLGIDNIIETATRAGIYDKVPRNFSMVLGAAETTLIRLTNAYAIIANGGRRVQPALIERIQDKNGKTVYARDARPCDGCTFASVTDASASSPPIPPDLREQVLDTAVAYQMTSILEGAVQRGTGTRAKVLERPLAGKTGTTNDSNDTWFIGFSPNLVCGVFVGFDKPKTLGAKETGASVALPAFVSFMKDALKDTPPVPFRVPPEVQMVKVDYESGQSTSGQVDGRHIIMEAFRATNLDVASTGDGTEGEGVAPLSALDESAALNLPLNGENAPPPPLPQENGDTALPLPEGGGVPGQWRGPVARSKGQPVDVPSGTGGLY